MFRKLLRYVFSSAAACMVAACAQTPSSTAGYAPYGHPAQDTQAVSSQPAVPFGKKIRLKAQNIKFISSYNPPNRAPNIDHLLLVTPEQIVHKWAENRFAVNGTPDRFVRFLIKDASIVEENVITGSCFKTVMQQYTGKLEVTIQIVDSEGRVLIETTAQAVKRELMEGSSSIEERQKVWVNLMFDLVRLLSARLDADVSSPAFNDFVDR